MHEISFKHIVRYLLFFCRARSAQSIVWSISKGNLRFSFAWPIIPIPKKFDTISSFREFCQAGLVVLPLNWGDPIPDKVTLDDAGLRRGPDGKIRRGKETEVNSTWICCSLCCKMCYNRSYFHTLELLLYHKVVIPIPRHDVPLSGKCDQLWGIG